MDKENLRKLQLKKMEALHEIERVCKKHGLRYFLDFGTLLGAIRHEGYIPWDDDIDLGMPVSDYMKFLEIAPKELSSDYFMQTAETDPPYDLPFIKIRTNGTTDLYIPWKKYKIHHGLSLDIFHIFPLANNKFLRFIQNKAAMIYKLSFSGRVLNGRRGLYTFQKIILLAPKFWRKVTWPLFACFSEEKATHWSHIIEEPRGYISSEGLFPLTTLKFEDKHYPVPRDYHTFMTSVYGDYMTPPPERERVEHEGFIVDLERSYEEYLED